MEHRSSYQETQPLDSLGSNSGLSQQPAPRPAKPNLFESVRAQQTKPTAVASTAAPASQQRRTGSRTEMPQQSDYKSGVLSLLPLFLWHHIGAMLTFIMSQGLQADAALY